MKRRLLSLILAFVMLLSLLPATALAAPGDGNGPGGNDNNNNWSYTVTLDVNGGTLPDGTSDKIEGTATGDSVTVDLPTTGLTPPEEGYKFAGWEGADEDEVSYTVDKPRRSNSVSVTLAAQWQWTGDWTYELVYEKNADSDTVEDMPESETNATGTFTLPTTDPVREGYNFLGWSTTTSSRWIVDEETITLSSDGVYNTKKVSQTLYAIWEEIEVVEFAWNQVDTDEDGDHAAADETDAEDIGKVTVQYYNSAGVLTTLTEKATVDWSLITSRGVVITAEAGWKITGISIRCNDNDGINCSTFSSHMANMTQAYSGVTKEITFTGAEMAALWQLHVTASNGNGRGDPYWLCISVDRDTTTSGGEEVQNYYDITYYNTASVVTPDLTGYVDSDTDMFLETASVDTLDRTAVNPITGNLFGAEFHVSGLTNGVLTAASGYEFLGWQVQYSTDDGSTWTDATTDGSLVQPYSIVAVKGDVRLIARWQKVEATYSVTYQDGVDNEEVFKDQVYDNLTAGTAVDTVAKFNSVSENKATVDDSGDPTRTGYIFDGWVDPFGYAADPATDTVTGNMVYIATWKPDMAVDKTVTDDGDTGTDGADILGTVVWTITITNNSPVAQTFTLEDALSTSARGVNDREVTVEAVSNSITSNGNNSYTIGAKTSGTITVSYTTALADSGMNLVNTVTITTEEGNYTFSDTAPGVPVEEAAAQLSVVKNVSSIGNATGLESKTHEELPEAEPGETITWTITVTNSGTADGYFELVDLLLADGDDYSDYVTVTPGEEVETSEDEATLGMYIAPADSSVSFTVSYTVDETNDYGKEFSNRAIITDRDDDEIDRDEAEPVDVEGKKYTVVYRYAGYVPADATSIDSINNARGGEFKHGDTVTVAGVPTASGYVFSGWSSDDVDVSAKEFSMPASDVTIKGSWTPKVDVEKTLVTDNSNPIEIGKTVEWTITVKNNTTEAQTFTLTDKLTVDYHTHDITNIVTTTPDVVTENADGTWTLAAGKTAEFTAKFTVLDGDHGKTLENTATVKLSDGFEFSDDSDKDPKVEDVDKQLEVTKTVYNGITTAKVGDTIIWEIKVENTGNTKLEGIILSDSLTDGDGESLAVSEFYTDPSCKTPFANTGFTLEKKYDYQTVYTKYTVKSTDAGKTIKNAAYAQSTDETNDTGISEVPVKYTLTIELYTIELGQSIADKVKVDNYGTTVHYDNGAHWYVNIEGQENPTHYGDTIPLTLTKDGKNYVFDPVATTDPLSGVIDGENVVVQYIYSPDEIGEGDDPDKPDGIPDRYQITVNYVSEDANKGTVSPAKEVLTIYDAQGQWAEEGTAKLETGSVATAAANYIFTHWDLTKPDTSVIANVKPGKGYELHHAKSEEVYTFTAFFTEMDDSVGVEKKVSKVGDTTVSGTIPNAKVGETIEWEIKVWNAGNTDQITIKLEDILENAVGTATVYDSSNNPVDKDKEIALPLTYTEVAPMAFKAVYTVQLGDSGAVLTNEIVVTNNGGSNTDESDPVTIDPAYTVEKTTEQKTASVGETITWKIVVTNNSSVEIKDLSVEDALSGAYSVDAQATLDVTGTFDLAKDGSKTITATYVVQSDDVGHSINNTAIVSVPDGPEIIDTPDEPVVINNPKLSVTKELAADQVKEVAVGETITWTIKVKNEGNVNLTGIKLSDEVKDADGNVVGSASISRKGSTETLDLNTYSFDLIEGSEMNFVATYVVKDTDAGKTLNNTVVATAGDGTESQDTPEEPVKVKNPGLTVTKTVNGGKTTAKVGETITWTVKVENTGNTTLTNITLTDTLYAGNKILATLELKDSDGNKVTTIAELKSGDFVELTASYKVTVQDLGKTLKNVATASTPDDGPSDQGESPTTRVPNPSTPSVDPTPVKPQLNKEDHFAYIIGKDDGLVHPLDQITRAETATIFFRMLLEESRQYYWTQENNFVDVDITDWFNNAASTLNNAGIMTGRPGNQFAPYANITRGEFATLAVRFFLDEDVEITENNLTDVKGHWAEANINLAYALGLITGYPDDTFRPDQEITRAEAMVIVNRVLERHPDKDHLLDYMITWPDNMNPNIWYYADVQEATNSHIYVLMTDKNGEKYEIWQQLLPVRDWAALEKEWSEYNSSHNPGEVVDVGK